MRLYKIEMDKAHPSVRQGFVDREDLHRNIQMFFNKNREEAGVLYRVYGNHVYVSSKCDPVIDEANGMRIQYSKEMPKHMKGDKCRFSIFTQPYIKHKGKRIPIIHENERLDWIYRQGEKHGFKILSAGERGFGSVRSDRKGFNIKGYYYMGILEITDEERFYSAIEKGLGASKAYGLGMLMVV